MKVLVFVKKNKPFVKEALSYLRHRVDKCVVFEGATGEPFPRRALTQQCDLLISYLSPWIIPEKLLCRTKLWNINFHPGPPEYPGIGCTNFAIYNQEEKYGITAHLMKGSVDTGKIIFVKRFCVDRKDTVESLTRKSYQHMFRSFLQVMNFIFKEKQLPLCQEVWRRIPYKRSELEALCVIKPYMSKKEIERRIKATTFPGMPGAYMKIHGHTFEYKGCK